MKLVSLRFKAFGAYLKEQFISFESLSNAGVFLISGKTGAGKTIILDAITYALYGKSSGGTRGDIYAMRCQYATATDDTEVELIFEVCGNRYKFTRTLQQKRINIASTQNAFFLSDDERFVPFFENPHLRDVEQKAIELIGLNYEQFRQVIILPQGQFEKLLVAKSEEKEKILVSLFGVQKWQHAANLYFDYVNEKKRELDNLKLQIENILEGYECENVEQLQQLAVEKEDAYTKSKKEEILLTQQYTKLKKEAEQKFLLAEKFEEMDKLESRRAELEGLSDKISVISKKIERILCALKLKPIFDKTEELRMEAHRREIDLQKKDKEYSESLTSSRLYKNKLEKLNSLKENNQVNKNKISELESMKSIFADIELLEKSLYEKINESQKQSDAVSILDKSTQMCRKKYEATEKEVLFLYNEYNNMLSVYIHGISSVLAKELERNKPCPVCGSTVHPSPAVASEGNVNESDLKHKDAQIKRKTSERDMLKNKLETNECNLKKERDLLQKQCVEIERDTAVIENMRSGLKTSAKNLKQLHDIIYNLQKSVSEFELELTKAESESAEIESKLIENKAKLQIAEKENRLIQEEFAKSVSSFEQLLKENIFASEKEFIYFLSMEEECSDLQEKVAAYDREKQHVELRMNELVSELKGKVTPDVSVIREELATAESNLLVCNSANALLLAENESITKTLSELRKKYHNYLEEAEKNSKDIIFGKRMRGDSGIGIQRYILGIVLSQVTVEANRLLENVHNGRYRLLRTLEGSGLVRKTGLELEVYDNFTGERRSVSTLSGGEKFLVSLSLSIGLSTVVQAESSSINIETMFIDEGFGSLDPASISDALNVLCRMRSNGSLIGIISHVDELKDSITTQIEVKKDRGGSTLTLRI